MRKRNFILTSAVAAALFLVVEAFPQQGGGQAGGAAKGGGAQGGQGKGGQNANNGQQPQQAPGALTGQVVSSTTGEPLRKVSLTLQPQGRGGGGNNNGGGGGPAATTSDQSGNFKFANLQPGTYQLSGERTGYVRGVHGEDRPGQQGTPITITSNQTQGGITFKLVPHSVITGRVYDLDGDPVQSAEVAVLRYSYPRGARQMTNVANATTNDLGEYRVANLPPGRYYVNATDRGVLGTIRNLIGNNGGGRNNINVQDLAGRGGRGNILEQLLGTNAVDPEAYVTTYYPRTTEPSGATPLNLVPGSETRGIDIGLLKGRLYSISGLVEGLPLPTAQTAQTNTKGGKGNNNNNKGGKGKGGDFQGGNQAEVRLTPRTSGQQQNGIEQLLGGQAQVNADGTFQMKGIRPGAYYLMAQARGPNNSRYSGRQPVDVTSGEVTGVRVRLSPPLEITGRISPEKPDADLKLQQVRVNFVPSVQSGGGRGGNNQQRVDTDAEGKFKGTLDMDSYTVELQGANNYYLKSVKLAGQPLENNVLDLNFSGAVLDVVLAKDSGAITGKVEKSNGDPVANARVTVVPTNNSPRRDLYKSATSSTDGTYTISNLPPGSYRVFAWEEVEQNAWMDQDFRRPFDGQGANADVKDTNGATVNLRVIGREQIAAIQ